MKTTNLILGSTCFLFAMAAAAGCSSAREVEVTGEAKAASSVQGPITIQFFEVPADGEDLGDALASTKLDKLGSFSQKVEVEGDQVRVLALADTNADGKCSEGEAWAQADAKISADDKVEPISLELTAAACPAAK